MLYCYGSITSIPHSEEKEIIRDTKDKVRRKPQFLTFQLTFRRFRRLHSCRGRRSWALAMFSPDVTRSGPNSGRAMPERFSHMNKASGTAETERLSSVAGR
jgi:hypothetical protein